MMYKKYSRKGQKNCSRGSTESLIQVKTVLYRKSYTEKTVKNILMKNDSDKSNLILLYCLSLLMDYLVGKVKLEFLLKENERFYVDRQNIVEKPLLGAITKLHQLKERMERGEDGEETAKAIITEVVDGLTVAKSEVLS